MIRLHHASVLLPNKDVVCTSTVCFITSLLSTNWLFPVSTKISQPLSPSLFFDGTLKFFGSVQFRRQSRRFCLRKTLYLNSPMKFWRSFIFYC